MKHFLSVSAIVLAGATAANAATEADLQKIQTVIPEATMAELDAMGDAKVASIVNAISQGDTGGDSDDGVRALYRDSLGTVTPTTATSDFVNETNLAVIQNHIPEATLADLAALGDRRVASILNAISSADSEADATEAASALYAEAMAETMTTPMATDGFANEANLSTIQEYVPDLTMAELEAVGNERIASILNAISADDGGDLKGTIVTLLDR